LWRFFPLAVKENGGAAPMSEFGAYRISLRSIRYRSGLFGMTRMEEKLDVLWVLIAI
jgi:hypothetical protein